MMPVFLSHGPLLLAQVTEGEIGPFSSIKVPILFNPVIPGEVQTKFKVMFKNSQCPTVSIPAALGARRFPFAHA